MNKPANLIVEETGEKIAKIINESGLPPFLLEPLLKDIYKQISFLKQKELENSKKDYEESLKEKKKEVANGYNTFRRWNKNTRGVCNNK